MMTNAIERLRHAVHTLPGVLAAFSEGESEQRPSPERWTKKEVIGHLIDSASNNHQRFVRGQLAAGQDFPQYEQEGWVRVQHYEQLPFQQVLGLWQTLNLHLAHTVEHLDPASLPHVWHYQNRSLTLGFIIEDYVRHLKHHLRALHMQV